MKKVFPAIMALMLILVCTAAAADHHFEKVTGEDGKVYDLFVVTRLNFGEDHKVTSVTGHFERFAPGEEAAEEMTSETLPDSETSFSLAEDFQALMAAEPNIFEQTVTVTDLYRWFVDTYIGGEEELEGQEIVFQYDFPEEERIDATFDFSFLITRIELNELNEIVYMEHVYAPWA